MAVNKKTLGMEQVVLWHIGVSCIYTAVPQGSIDGILAARPDVVVLDVQLEGGSGLQVLRAVHQAAPEIAFVVFSNNSGPAYRKRYLGEGAVGFLDKSTEFDQLTRAVANASHPAAH